MRIVQINTTVNSGSTGRIAEDLGKVAIAHGHESYIAYGRGNRPSVSKLIRIGRKSDVILHGLASALFDRHGFASSDATRRLIRELEKIDPDVISLHNLHGYYLNIQLLFRHLSKTNTPVVWTLFDCWAFTGHCTYFDDIKCERWIEGCFSCPKTTRYPSSYFLDNSKSNYALKKELFTSHKNLSIVVHSEWLFRLTNKSFLGTYPIKLIRSGVDVEAFRPIESDIKERLGLEGKKLILGCASIWDKRKGLSEFLRLNERKNASEVIVLVGLTSEQIKSLPEGIVGISRTESVTELAKIYSAADVFVNPTFQDNFPTTNLEALACGTPVITYDTGGSAEAVNGDTGVVVEKGNLRSLYDAIQTVMNNGKDHYSKSCRNRALSLFDKNDRAGDYIELYKTVLNN